MYFCPLAFEVLMHEMGRLSHILGQVHKFTEPRSSKLSHANFAFFHLTLGQNLR